MTFTTVYQEADAPSQNSIVSTITTQFPHQSNFVVCSPYQVEAVIRQRDMYRVLLANSGQTPVRSNYF